MKIETRTKTEVDVTPQVLADIFWNMSSIEQAEFFSALSKNGDAYLRYMQWWDLHKQITEKKNKNAQSVLMDIAAPFYLNALQKIG